MAEEKPTKKDLMTVFWRSFAIMGSMNYERMQGLGFAWSLFPCLKKIYKDNSKKLCEALSRHMAAFNCATARFLLSWELFWLWKSKTQTVMISIHPLSAPSKLL